MDVIILAGGLGTRIAEETDKKPKPLVEIGGYPILWHIMKIYYHQGFKNFIIAGGYRFEMIEPAIRNHFEKPSDLDFTVLDTGLDTSTGGRLRKCIEYSASDTLLATYGDGVANVDIKSLLEVHKNEGRLVTLTAVRPPARFGRLTLEGSRVSKFGEKSQSEEGWINGGFFAMNREVTEFLRDDSVPFETIPLSQLANENKLSAYLHQGFWHPMDTLREKRDLEALWNLNAPWKIW